MANIKDLFNKTYSSASLGTIGEEAESYRYIEAWKKDKDRFIPAVDFSNAGNFAKFGSAEQYYEDAISRIYKTYPYDGSLFERLDWYNSASYFDIHIFDNEYPRTNGYVIFSAHTGGVGASGWGTQNGLYDGYGAPETGSYEYISIKGGPHTSKRVKGKDIQDTSGDWTDGYANILDLGKRRESNLKIGGTKGNTVEFWMKKDEFLPSLTNKEVIFDVALTTNGGASAEDSARLTIEMSGGQGYNDSPFYVTYMSGTENAAGFATASIGKDITTGSIADGAWHHYAFTFKNVSSNLESKLYIDGKCNHTITGAVENLYKGSAVASETLAGTVGYISGTLTGTIGALCAHTVDSTRTEAGLGWGKLSASIDDFRFWKTKRSSKDINLNYFRDIGGGTNTDLANTDLGIYYKFNEGVTQTSSVDQTILDYSGRISNGTFNNYKTVSRSTGSAIVESSASAAEFKDPILYSFHPRVSAYAEGKRKIGVEYDYRNNASMYHSLPAWIIEEDEYKGDLTAKKLTQIMSSYFDTVWLQIDSLNKLKNETYFSSSFKPLPFTRKLLTDKGLFTPELFADATILEHMLQQSHNKKFEDKIHNLKNLIYQNIYNNLIYIYKSKGTEKSFRNLIRCFGVDDELIKFNIYGHGITYDLKDNFRDSVVRKNYVNFYTSDTNDSVVYQMTASSNLNSTSFMSGTIDSGSAMTFETEVLFPKQFKVNEANWIPADFVSSSIFGIHMPASEVGDQGDTAWNNPDAANFQVYAVRKTLHEDVISGKGYTKSDVRFMLTSSRKSLALELTSSTFKNVYDNRKWNFAVRVLPKSHPQSYKLGGSHFANQDYKVEFYGVNIDKDTILESFFVTGTVDSSRGVTFLTSSKRLYIGAHRTDFSGTLQAPTDIRISSTRAWADYIPNGAINAHARDASNFGTLNAYWHAYPGQTKLTDNYIPQLETLALHWDFNQVTSSNSDGFFAVQDISSGSVYLNDRYGTQGHLLKKQHTGVGYNFPANTTVITKEFVQSSKQSLPENLHSSDTIKILESEADDDLIFTRETRPISHFFAFEKSMYQVISEEIINFFATIVDFNNLIGEPVNRYRQDYKDLSKLRQLFFERVGNTPNLVKFIDYYKWIDSALGIFLEQLVPASAEFGQGIRNMVESHILERNKYWTKFPTLEIKLDDPEAHLFGINEMLYNWKQGHAPVPAVATDQSDNCLWWKDRSTKAAPYSSGDSNVDNNRQTIQTTYTSKNVSGSTYAIRRFSRPYRYKVERNKIIHGGTNFSDNKKLDYSNAIFRVFDNSDANNHLQASASYFKTGSVDTYSGHIAVDCQDDPTLNTKRKFVFKVEGANSEAGKGELLFPFNILTQDNVDQKLDGNQGPANARIVNLHHDTYGSDKEVPMQGPFTEKHVGGKQHRHVWTHLGTGNDATNREEGWRLSQSATPSNEWYKVSNPLDSDFGGYDNPRAVFYRDETAKRPVNIRNIRQTTGSSAKGYYTNIGNYTHDYEVVQTHGRSTNNRALVEDGAINIIAVEDNVFSGHVGFNLPDRDIAGTNKFVFVNKFSAPGGAEVMSRGFLDVEAEEYSVYNALPWRNLSVRTALKELLTNHTKQFGYQSDMQNSSSWARAIAAGFIYPGAYDGISGAASVYTYEGTASYHKVNRNTKKVLKFEGAYGSAGGLGHVSEGGTVITASQYDNWYVRHQIPQSDMQYAWITASAENIIVGYQQPDHSLASFASSDVSGGLRFLSASEFGTFYNLGLNVRRWGADKRHGASNIIDASRHHTDFAGLNFHILEPITSSDNNVGWPLGTPYIGDAALTDAQYLNRHFISSVVGGYSINEGAQPSGRDSGVAFNAIMLNRGGIYGWPSWKQIRTGEHPVARYQRKNNNINFPDYKLPKVGQTIKIFDRFIHFTEPPVSSRYRPMIHRIDTTDKKGLTLEHTYGNNLVYFSTHDGVNGDLLNIEHTSINLNSEIGKQFYEDLKSIYIDNEVEVLSSLKFKNLLYRETIFPREQNTYLKKVRGRTRYTEESEVNGEENDWPLSVVTENSINRRVFAIHPNKIRNYRPLRTFWRAKEVDRMRLEGRYQARNDLDFLQVPGSTWNYNSSPGAAGYNDVGTSSAGLSVWPLDCNYPGTSLAVSARDQIANTSYTSNWRYSMNLPTTSSANFSLTAEADKVFVENGALGTTQFWHWYNNAYSYHLKAFDNWTAGNTSGFQPLANSASLCYEYPRFDVVSQSAANANHKSHMWWATYRANKQAGRDPWYDSYDDYAEDIRVMGQNYSVIPEFRISEHMDKYLSSAHGFHVKNNEFLTLEGADIFSASSDVVDDQFYTTFSHTEFMKYYKAIKSDHDGIAKPKMFKLTCKGIKKLLPYNGFYPMLRTVQLGAMLSQSFGPHIIATTGSGVDPDTLGANNLGTINQKIPAEWRAEGLQAFLDLFYAPGIMYNTIKSGIAVDYPALTGTIIPAGDNKYTNSETSFDYRLSFESLLNPAEVLPISSSDDLSRSGLSRIIGNVTAETLQAAAQLGRTHEFAWDGDSDFRYSLAAHNFFGEIPKFFLEKEVFTSFVSTPQHKCDLIFQSGTTYYMDVDMYKTKDFIMYEGPSKFAVNGGDGSPQGTWHGATTDKAPYTIHARGAPYGFPMQIQDTLGSEANFLEHYKSGNIGGASFAAYTPPYFYGRATARMVFKPDQAREMFEKESSEFAFKEIIDYCKNNTHYFNSYAGLNADTMRDSLVMNARPHGMPSASHENLAFVNAMQLSASVNLFTRTSIKKAKWAAITGQALEVEESPEDSFNVWSVNSKFETPILNYSGALDSNLYGDNRVPHCCDGDFASGYSTAKVPATSFGVWKDYGLIPNNNEGIFIELKDSFRPAAYNPKTGSLFKRIFGSEGKGGKKKQLGRLADSKEISEAVIAMPYRVVGNKREFISIIKEKANINLLREITTLDPAGLLGADLSAEAFEVATNIFGQSIWGMCQKIGKYIIPPQFDWINNNSTTPYAMYIFEFTHTLDKEELSYIWQNLMPDIARTAVEVPGFDPFTGEHHDAPEVSHPIRFKSTIPGTTIPRELLTGEDLDDPTLRWMVFKVKRRAEKSYYASTIDTTDDAKFKFSFNIGEGTSVGQKAFDTTYSYNWPYDFFSLVELAKIDAEVKFSQVSIAGTSEEDIIEAVQLLDDVKTIIEDETGARADTNTVKEVLEVASQGADILDRKVEIPHGAQSGDDPHGHGTQPSGFSGADQAPGQEEEEGR